MCIRDSPDLYFKKKRRLRLVVLIAFIFSITVSGFVYQLLNMYQELDQVKAENAILINSIQEKQEESRRQGLLTSLKKRIEFKVDLLKEIEAENASVLNITEAIESALPQGVIYVNANFSSTEAMTIFGETEKENEIPDLIHKLRNLNVFHEVRVSSIKRVERLNYTGVETVYEFILSCNFGGADDEIDK